MIQTLKNNIAIILASLGLLLVGALAPVTVNAQDASTNIQQSVNCGVGSGSGNVGLGNSCGTPTGQEDKVASIIRTVINVASAIVGAVSVVMIIIGGFKYITSGGDSNNVSGAKNTILYAIVGLVIVAFAQIIVQFVLERSTV
jgi:Type IV secretion system pilin